MRLWSIHPEYLDTKGLVALWREGLLAKKVLAGRTRGYTRHPQLLRFKELADPPAAVDAYLTEVLAEATGRGFYFNSDLIVPRVLERAIAVTRGQLAYEREHLLGKLRIRDQSRHERLVACPSLRPHPLFYPVAGEVAPWERPS